MSLDTESGANAAHIRVLVADLAGERAKQVACLIEQQGDMVLVGRAEGPVDLVLSVGVGVDVLVLGAAQVRPPPGVCSHLWGEYPDLKILLLPAAGDGGMLYWLGLREQQVPDLSTTTLLGTIRHAYTLNPTV